MINALKFVRGAVAKKDSIPALTHFRIENRKIKGFNGTIGLCSPINIDLDVSPKGIQFIKAIDACDETIAFHIATNGKLAIRSGSFKTFVDCNEISNFPDIEPTGRMVELNNNFLPALEYLEKFIATDETRPWANGILFDGESAFATNNIVLLEYWLGFKFPLRVNVPAVAVHELLRIGENPIRLQMTEHRLIFHYSGDRWLSTQLLSKEWPDAHALLSKAAAACALEQKCFPKGFFEALETLLPFTDQSNRCFLSDNQIASTGLAEISGTSLKLKGELKGIYNSKHLLNLKGIADTIAFAAYPLPVGFCGKKTRGIILGFRA